MPKKPAKKKLGKKPETIKTMATARRDQAGAEEAGAKKG
jgi:hypothetical protein